MNKIIAMSVWGDSPQYITGCSNQIQLFTEHLPDWQIRVYTDGTTGLPDFGDKVSVIRVTDGSYGMYWRFLPMWESPDTIMISRDADSRLTFRELAAIREWEYSDMKFHVIKDHEAHYEFPIMGGLFGCKGQLPKVCFDQMNAIKHHHGYCGDQIFLANYVWPIVNKTIMVHSMYSTDWFAQTRSQLRNKYSFCGNGYDQNNMPLYPDSLSTTIDNTLPIHDLQFDFGVLNSHLTT